MDLMQLFFQALEGISTLLFSALFHPCGSLTMAPVSARIQVFAPCQPLLARHGRTLCNNQLQKQNSWSFVAWSCSGRRLDHPSSLWWSNHVHWNQLSKRCLRSRLFHPVLLSHWLYWKDALSQWLKQWDSWYCWWMEISSDGSFVSLGVSWTLLRYLPCLSFPAAQNISTKYLCRSSDFVPNVATHILN